MLRIDPAADAAPYVQLRTQLEAQMTSGALEPGSRLPAVRRLAADLGISPGTVARAYRELETAGLVTASRRGGTVVAESAPAGADKPAAGQTIAETVRGFVASLRAAGVNDEEILELTRTALKGAPSP